jgi:hypothetical protein
MRRLSIQAGGQVSTTGQDQPIQLSHHWPEHPKEQRKGAIIAEQLQGVIALDQWQRWNEAGHASGLQDRVYRGRIPTIAGPASITHIALCSQHADAWPLSQDETIALLLFRYPVCKQVTDRGILSRVSIYWRKIAHSVTPTRYLSYDRFAEHV